MAKKMSFKEMAKMYAPGLIVLNKSLTAGNFRKRKELVIESKAGNHLPLCRIERTNDIKIPNVLKITQDGYQHPFYIRNHSSDVFVYRSLITDNEYNFVSSQEPEVIIDAGAHIGLAAIQFANKFPNAKIISIEPEKNNFYLLEQNTKKYSNIIALQAALWDKVGEIELLDTGFDSWGFMTANDSQHDKYNVPLLQKKHNVRSVTIESLFSEYNLSRIDILKMDIEGAEIEVFRNHSPWVNHVRSIIVELHGRIRPGCGKAFRKIAKKFDDVAIAGEDFYLSKNGFIKMK